MLGEYDFFDEKLRDSVGILPPEINRLKHTKIRERPERRKVSHINSVTKPPCRNWPLCCNELYSIQSDEYILFFSLYSQLDRIAMPQFN